jgi:outer membrane protein TolC
MTASNNTFMHYRSIFLWGICLLLWGNYSIAQPAKSGLSIEQAYSLARSNYPLIKQAELIKKTTAYSLENASKGYLPVFSISGQATYQSAVTNFPFKIPIAGFTIPAYSKDQYKVYAQVDQVIYDAGLIKNQQQSIQNNDIIQQQSLEVELYAIYDRVNQLFFGALLLDEQLKQNQLVKQDVQNGIDKARALLANGTAYRSSVDELSAQLLQVDQSRIEMEAMKKAYLNMLALFTNIPLNETSVLEKPAELELATEITRPELTLFDYQQKQILTQEQLLKIQLRPKFNVFLQGGYGRPGLNMLSNDFAWYYMGGLRLNWNFGSWYTLKNQREILGINKNNIDIQKQTFLLNTRISQAQQNDQLLKFKELAKTDLAIIELRTSVKKAASAQLENGVLSPHDYLNQVNAEDQARQNLILHQIQSLQTQYSFRNITGNAKAK